MEELAKAVQKKYIEDITKKYPLHRFVILFLFLLSAHIYSNELNLRVLDSIKQIKISFVFDFKSGMLSSITFEQLFLCILLTAIVSNIYNEFSSKAFSLLSRLSKFESYISEIETKVSRTKSNHEMLNYFLSKDVSKQLETLRVQLKSYHVRSELCLAVILCILYGVKNMIVVDWVVVITLFSYILINSWVSFRFYISDFLPYYVTEQTLLGGKVVFGDK